jgi:hypothetical protein
MVIAARMASNGRMAGVSARSRRRSELGALAVASIVTLAGAAAADDLAKARELFAGGVHRYEIGDYEGALRLFREANGEHHAPAIVYNVALAEEKLGHRQAAVDAYESYIAEAGDRGEFTSAAVAAVAQIRATSTKLRIETKPPGAHVFVDGNALAEPAPITVLVGAGHHVVVAQGESFRAEKELDARGGGESLVVALAPAAPVEPPAPPPSPIAVAPPAPAVVAPPPPPEPGPDALVWGAAFAIAPAVMFGVDPIDDEGRGHSNTKTILTILAGPMLEIGYALTDKIEFLARGLAGIGPDSKPSFMYLGGPGLSFKLGPIWAGATFIGGDIDSARHGVKYSTDLVFGAMGEVAVPVLKKAHGEWLVGVQPSFLLTEMRNDNTTLFFPLSFGYRAY